MTTERKCPDCGCCCDYSSPCCNLKGGNADHPGGCKKITSGNLYISSTIGTPAVLEQLAEESADLAQAALKFARKLRDENPTPKSEEECLQDLLSLRGIVGADQIAQWNTRYDAKGKKVLDDD